MADYLEQRKKEDSCLESEDIADAVLYVLATPPHVQVIISQSIYQYITLHSSFSLQVHELTIKPVGEHL